MHYSFITYGSWENNAGLIRPKYLGAELIKRAGARVTYIVDDMPYNRDALKLHPKAEIALVPNARSMKQIASRRRVIRALAPDYIHLLNSHAKSVAALLGNGRLQVVADWDEPPTVKDLGFMRNRLEHAADAWLRRRADVRIVCTMYLQQRFREMYGMETVYIPHAPYFAQQPQVSSPFTQPTAVYMGNLFSSWDHDILFDAARLMREAGHQPKIMLLGDGPDRAKWEAFIALHKLDNFTLAGFMSGAELWRHLRYAHVLLFPIRDTVINRSRCPSKIFAYAQAMRPLITNRVGELPYLLNETPIYIDQTPQAFADALLKLMNEPPQPDVTYHTEQHTWGDRAERLLAAIRAAEENRRRQA